MGLCDLCQSIVWEDLPPFPDDLYERNATGLQHVHSLFAKEEHTGEQLTARIKYHSSLEGLQRAAEDGCELCTMVKGQADALLAEIDGLEGIQREMEGSPPTFDMWLTKRPEHGEGFWILSETKQGEETLSFESPATLLVAAIGFSAIESTSLATEFRGRPIKEQPDAGVISMVKGWVANCSANHDCCVRVAPLPSRLIDVESLTPGPDSSVKLVDFEQERMGTYSALSFSHEGGVGKDLARPSGISGDASTLKITNLPKVFYDAILVTRQLGINYLWIDAICIPVDQFDNFGRDSPAFASIYSNAYLTLAATGADGTSEGLFFPRTGAPYIHIPHQTKNGVSGDLWMHNLSLVKEFMGRPATMMEKEPLCRGIWAFQERVLSKRTIHFAGDQIYFECLKQFRSEDGLLMNESFHSTEQANPDETDNDGLARWFGILWHYTICDIADSSDKLSALANIANAYSEILGDEYVAGLWKSSLIECLCWQSVECKPVNEYRAPSWSWASVDGLVGVGFATKRWEPMATIQHTNIELLDASKPFGKVKSGSIKLEAPMVALAVSDSKGFTGEAMLRIKDKEGDEGFHASLDTMYKTDSDACETLRGMELWAILLAEAQMLDCGPGDCGMNAAYHGIIVTAVEGQADTMKRIGFIISDPEEIGSEYLQAKKCVTLV